MISHDLNTIQQAQDLSNLEILFSVLETQDSTSPQYASIVKKIFEVDNLQAIQYQNILMSKWLDVSENNVFLKNIPAEEKNHWVMIFKNCIQNPRGSIEHKINTLQIIATLSGKSGELEVLKLELYNELTKTLSLKDENCHNDIENYKTLSELKFLDSDTTNILTLELSYVLTLLSAPQLSSVPIEPIIKLSKMLAYTSEEMAIKTISLLAPKITITPIKLLKGLIKLLVDNYFLNSDLKNIILNSIKLLAHKLPPLENSMKEIVKFSKIDALREVAIETLQLLAPKLSSISIDSLQNVTKILTKHQLDDEQKEIVVKAIKALVKKLIPEKSNGTSDKLFKDNIKTAMEMLKNNTLKEIAIEIITSQIPKLTNISDSLLEGFASLLIDRPTIKITFDFFIALESKLTFSQKSQIINLLNHVISKRNKNSSISILCHFLSEHLRTEIFNPSRAAYNIIKAYIFNAITWLNEFNLHIEQQAIDYQDNNVFDEPSFSPHIKNKIFKFLSLEELLDIQYISKADHYAIMKIIFRKDEPKAYLYQDFFMSNWLKTIGKNSFLTTISSHDKNDWINILMNRIKAPKGSISHKLNCLWVLTTLAGINDELEPITKKTNDSIIECLSLENFYSELTYFPILISIISKSSKEKDRLVTAINELKQGNKLLKILTILEAQSSSTKERSNHYITHITEDNTIKTLTPPSLEEMEETIRIEIETLEKFNPVKVRYIKRAIDFRQKFVTKHRANEMLKLLVIKLIHKLNNTDFYECSSLVMIYTLVNQIPRLSEVSEDAITMLPEILIKARDIKIIQVLNELAPKLSNEQQEKLIQLFIAMLNEENNQGIYHLISLSLVSLMPSLSFTPEILLKITLILINHLENQKNEDLYGDEAGKIFKALFTLLPMLESNPLALIKINQKNYQVDFILSFFSKIYNFLNSIENKVENCYSKKNVTFFKAQDVNHEKIYQVLLQDRHLSGFSKAFFALALIRNDSERQINFNMVMILKNQGDIEFNPNETIEKNLQSIIQNSWPESDDAEEYLTQMLQYTQNAINSKDYHDIEAIKDILESIQNGTFVVNATLLQHT